LCSEATLSHALLVCSKHILYTSRATTGNDEVEGDPDKDQYFIMIWDRKADTFADLEISRALWEATTAGEIWEYRKQPSGVFVFQPRL